MEDQKQSYQAKLHGLEKTLQEQKKKHAAADQGIDYLEEKATTFQNHCTEEMWGEIENWRATMEEVLSESSEEIKKTESKIAMLPVLDKLNKISKEAGVDDMFEFDVEEL